MIGAGDDDQQADTDDGDGDETESRRDSIELRTTLRDMGSSPEDFAERQAEGEDTPAVETDAERREDEVEETKGGSTDDSDDDNNSDDTAESDEGRVLEDDEIEDVVEML